MHQLQAAPLATRLATPTSIVLLSVFLNFAGFTLIIPVLPFWWPAMSRLPTWHSGSR